MLKRKLSYYLYIHVKHQSLLELLQKWSILNMALTEDSKLFDNSKQNNNKKCLTTHMPPDLDLWPTDPKINRGHLLVIINQHIKYEDSVMKGIQNNQRKPSGLPTDQQTDISKTIYPLFFEGGGGIINTLNVKNPIMST